MTQVALNDATLVNTTTEGQQYDAAIAPLPLGGFVIVWDDNERQEVYGQRYDPAGNKIGGEFQVNTTTAGTQFYPTVAALEGGGFVVAWQSGTLSNADIYARRFDSAGNAVGDDFLVNNATADEQLNARVVGIHGGGFVISWDTIAGGKYQEVTGRIYNSAGVATGVGFTVNTDTDDQQGFSSLAPIGAGFAVIYQSILEEGSNNVEIVGQRFFADGTRDGDEFQVNTTTAQSQYGQDVAQLSDGGLIITWTDPGSDQIVARRLDANGDALTGEIPVFTPTAPTIGGTSVTGLADGGWLVTWAQGDGNANHLFARAFDAANAPLGDPFEVSQNTIDFPVQTTDAVVMLPNGNVVFAWDGPTTGTDQDIFMRIFFQALAGDGLTGDDGDNEIHGTSGNDEIFGLGGDDVLVGQEGDDVLDGGPGADRLYGGPGDDIFLGGAYADQMFELPGEGNDTVLADVAFYLYADIEDLQLTSGAGDAYGVGNALANTITGNSGSNLLIGGLGDDTLHGGDGVDSLFGEDGNDSLFGDAGVDYLVGGLGNDALDGGDDADSLYGEAGDDTLWAGSGFVTDILVGGDANDVLHADSGANDYDLIDGGAGDDSFYVDTGDDLTFEAEGGGNDTVLADVSNVPNAGVYLYANVENLVLLGTTAFGVGNELANTLTGSASGNWLLGGAGNDTLNGKAGGDVLFGEAGADVFVFEHGSGGDVIGDFHHGEDRMDLSAFGIADFATLANGFHQVGSDGAIDLGGGDFIVLHGVTMSTLDGGDFVL